MRLPRLALSWQRSQVLRSNDNPLSISLKQNVSLFYRGGAVCSNISRPVYSPMNCTGATKPNRARLKVRSSEGSFYNVYYYYWYCCCCCRCCCCPPQPLLVLLLLLLLLPLRLRLGYYYCYCYYCWCYYCWCYVHLTAAAANITAANTATITTKTCCCCRCYRCYYRNYQYHCCSCCCWCSKMLLLMLQWDDHES